MIANPMLLFDYRLAMALGKTVEEIGQMQYGEYIGWLAYETLEPFGYSVEERRYANQMQLTQNLGVSKKSERKTAKTYFYDGVAEMKKWLSKKSSAKRRKELMKTPEGREELAMIEERQMGAMFSSQGFTVNKGERDKWQQALRQQRLRHS